jgi:hypothetical protein
MLDVLDAAGGEVVDDADFIAALEVRLGQVGADESGASSDQKPQRESSCRFRRVRMRNQYVE